jgi:hypothetical protein
VESPCDSALIPDGAALSAFQYFENVRNFLVAVQEMGIPTFEASDLEQVCFFFFFCIFVFFFHVEFNLCCFLS